MRPLFFFLLTLSFLSSCGEGPGEPPYYTAASVAVSGSKTGGVLNPGSYVVIYGKNLGPAKSCEGQEVELCGTAVRIGKDNLEVTYASATQVNFKTPANLALAAEAQLQLSYRGLAGPLVKIQIAAAP